MTKRCNFYGAYSFNGLGVYTNYSKLLRDREYMRGERIQGFGSREDAIRFAEDGFISLHGGDCLMDTVPDDDDLRINWYYFISVKNSEGFST